MNIFVIGEAKDGKVKRVTHEILSELKRQGQTATMVLVGGPEIEAAAQSAIGMGATKIVALSSGDLAQYSTEGYANALHAFLSTQSPGAILVGATALAKDQEWTYRVFVARFGGRIYRITLAATDYTPETDQRFRLAIQTFRRLTARESNAARPLRIALTSPGANDSAETLAAKMAVPDRQLDRFLVLNGLEPGDEITAGARYKIVVE